MSKPTDTEKCGIDLIAAERARQIAREGWTQSHDAHHVDEQLALAAATYALPACLRLHAGRDKRPITWPLTWDFKPTPNDRVRELVKAGALIAAEIDRLQASR